MSMLGKKMKGKPICTLNGADEGPMRTASLLQDASLIEKISTRRVSIKEPNLRLKFYS